jgi:hypothetical protein
MTGDETRRKYALVRHTATLYEIVLTKFLYQTDGAKNGCTQAIFCKSTTVLETRKH